MPDTLLNVLKFLLIALIWLFFIRAFRAVWVEVKQPAPGPGGNLRSGPGFAQAPAYAGVGAGPDFSAALAPAPQDNGPSVMLTVIAPPEYLNTLYELTDAESIIGRASGCAVPIEDDTFVSHLHARIYTRGAEFWIEDLGSTNGSFVNGKKLVSPIPLRNGDKIQVGRTVFEVSK